MQDEDDPRVRLTRFAEQLRKLSFPSSPISIALATFVADALDRYLSGDSESLDAAFGLTPRQGRPRDLEKHDAIAREIHAMKLEGKSWRDIADELNQCGVSDERTLRRIDNEFKVGLMAEDVWRQLKDEGGA